VIAEKIVDEVNGALWVLEIKNPCKNQHTAVATTRLFRFLHFVLSHQMNVGTENKSDNVTFYVALVLS